MCNKKSILDIPGSDLNGKRVLIRVDFNVPIKDGVITDDSRIKAAIPTIDYLKSHQAKIILISHLGRPKGAIVDSLRLLPIAQQLSKALNCPVSYIDELVGKKAEKAVSDLKPGEILLLENSRFYPGEEQNNPELSKSLSQYADIFVNDAFGTAHRAHASTEGVANYLPSYAGLLMKRELDFLGKAVDNPAHPFVAIIGGAKVSTKIAVLENLLGKVDTLIIGGGMTYTFLKAQGIPVGKSLVESEKLDVAKAFLEAAKSSHTQVLLPVDHVVTAEFSNTAATQTVSISQTPDNMMGLDIGPDSITLFQNAIKDAKTIIWNGPLGVFELSKFAKGTFAIANALAKTDATTIVGGGDSVAAINKAGVQDSITHISTGGGASLEFLEGKLLPGIEILENV